MKVFAPSYVIALIELEIGYALILNLLRLDSKRELIRMCGTQQLVLIERVQLLWECSNQMLQIAIFVM